MNGKAQTTKLGMLAVALAIAGSAIPTAGAAVAAGDPGLVARKLGSPDPREHMTRTQYSPGIAASRLGSPDPRDTVSASSGASAIARSLGSPDPRDTYLVQSAGAQAGDRFDWGDFGIGLGFGIGLSSILAGTVVFSAAAFRGRSVAQPLA